jgi:putative acetyltransferase
MAITVKAETPLQDDVRRLIGELNETLLVLTPLSSVST